ncbi:MAG: right-handed parallel beta-helix repeat-containing protein [Candidatus Micrarchaeota archaeon]
MSRILSLLALFVLLSHCLHASDAFMAYSSNTGACAGNLLNCPKIKLWNSSAAGGAGSWGSEVELATAGSPVIYVSAKWSPISDKKIIISQSEDGYLDAYVCMSNCGSSSSWTVTNNIGQIWFGATPTPLSRRVDVDFESSTGNAVVVYGVYSAVVTQDLAYKVLPANASSFSGITEQYINDGGHATNIQYSWVRMDRKPTAGSELIVTGFDSTDNDINSWVWDGASWGNQISISDASTATGGYEALAVRYAQDGSKGMSVGGTGTAGTVNTRYWNGSAWSAIIAFDIDPGDTLDARWINLKADPATDDLQMVIMDSGSDLHTSYWNGAAWAVTSNIDTGLDRNTERCADFEWSSAGSSGRLVWDTDGAGGRLSQRACSPQCTGGTSTTSTYVGRGRWITMYRNPAASQLVKILSARLNANIDIGSFFFDGTAYTNYGDSSITANTYSTATESYAVSFEPRSTCMVLRYPGNYSLHSDIAGAPLGTAVLTGSSTACVIISSSDVSLDCQGYLINSSNELGTTFGILVNKSQSNISIRNCRVTNYTYGFYIHDSNYTFLQNNTAFGNSNGFAIGNSSSTLNNITNCTAYSNGVGVNVSNSNLTLIRQASLFANTLDLYLASSLPAPASNIFNSSGLMFLNPAGTLLNYTNISVYDSLLTGERYSFKWTSNSSALPASHSSFRQKFINISSLGISSSITTITWHYLDSETSGYDERTFELWKYNSSGWSLLNSSPDTPGNRFTISGLNPTSDFGILENDGCRIISSPGSYQLNSSLSGAPIPASEVTDISWACMKIASSNVDFNCNGYSISNNGTGPAAGIVINGSTTVDYTNVTVRNCPSISGYYVGAYVYLSRLDTIRNVSSNNNTLADFYFYGSYYCALDNSTANGSSNYGYYVRDSYYTNLSNSAASFNSLGFYISTSQITNVTGSRAFNNSGNGFYFWAALDSDVPNIWSYLYNSSSYWNGGYGVRLTYASLATLRNMTANNNSGSGLFLDSSSNFYTLEDSRAYGNSQHGFQIESNMIGSANRNLAYGNSLAGFYLGPSSASHTLSNNSAHSNQDGFVVNSSSGNTFVGSQSYNNSRYGLRVLGSSSTNFTNTHAYGNRNLSVLVSEQSGSPMPVYFSNLSLDNPAGNTQNYTSLDIIDTVEANTAYSLNWTSNSSALPPSSLAFGWKFVNISAQNGTVSIDSISWRWLDSEIGGFDEGSFKLWKYNASGWASLNGTPDTAVNRLSLYSMNPLSDYGLLSSLTLNFTNVSISPDPQGFGFNVTVRVNVSNASSVMAGITAPSSSESNFTMTLLSGYLYELNYSNWLNGTYYLRFYANDSTGSWHNSSIYNFSLFQNLTIQIRTLKGGYTINESLNITDPEQIDDENPHIMRASFGNFDTPIKNKDIVPISVDVADRIGVTEVLALVPTKKGLNKVPLSLSSGTMFNGTWVGEWGAHNVAGHHFIIQITAKNRLNKSHYSYVSFGDPPGLWVIPTNDSDPTGLWTNRPNARDGDTHTYADDNSNPGSGWGSFITFNITGIESDRLRVWADYGIHVGSVDIDVFLNGSWQNAYEGPISSLSWSQINYSQGTVTAGRFRYNYTVGGWIYWLYEFQFYNVSTQVNLPVVSTRPATSVEENTSVLHSTVLSDGGASCQVRFLYGNTSGSYTQSTPWISEQYTGSLLGQRIYGLQDGTNYYFIAQLNNSAGATNGSEQSFTTGPASIGWVSATNYTDPNGQWSNELYAFDDELGSETSSYHDVNDPDGVWSFYLYLNRSTTLSDKIRFNAKATDVDLANVDVFANGSWLTVYNNSFTDSTWTEVTFNQSNVSSARIRFRAVANNRGFEWRLAEFDFYKQISTPTQNQSKLENNGPTDASCYLIMKTQFWNGTGWADDDTVFLDSSPRVLLPSEILKLDTLWNPMNYSTNSLSSGDGTYRVYAACLDNLSNTLLNLNGSYVVSAYNFTFDASAPLVNITSPQNNSNYTVFSSVPIRVNVTDFTGVTSVTANISNSIGYETLALTYNSTSGLWEGSYSNTNYVDTYMLQIIAVDMNGAVNDTESVIFNIIDTTPPNVVLNLPEDNYTNNSAVIATVVFSCNATDDYDVKNISLYITGPNNLSYSLNQTKNVSGVSTRANFTVSLGEGLYTWSCQAFDSSGNYDWADENRTVMIIRPCLISGTVKDATQGVVSSDVELYDANWSLIGSQTAVYNFTVACNHSYQFKVMPAIGNFSSLIINSLYVGQDIYEVVDLEDSPESMDSPDWLLAWNEAISWSPNMSLNFTNVTINLTYSGSNPAFYKCANWNYSIRNCTDDNWTYVTDLPPGLGQQYITNFTKADPGAGIGNKPNVTAWLVVYNVTGLNETQRRDNGTLVGTFFNLSTVNFTYGLSYRIEVFLDNSDPDTNGIIRDPYHDNIPEELVVDLSGADAPNVSVVAGTAILNPFTAVYMAGTDPGTRRLTWDADPPGKLIENLTNVDLVKLWYVVDFNISQNSLDNTTFFGDVQGTNDNVHLLNFFNTSGSASNCIVITSPGTYTLSGDAMGAPNNASEVGGSNATACIKIASSDVVFDCGGFDISYDGSEAGPVYGILLNGSTTNVTVRDCPSVSSYDYGYYLLNSNSSLVEGVGVSNSTYGFTLVSCSSLTIANSTSFGNDEGFRIDSCSNNTLTNNSAYDNGIFGFHILNSSGNNLTSNNATNNTFGGIYLNSSNSSLLLSNYVCFNDQNDLNNSGSGNSGNLDLCDFSASWAEFGHEGCEYTCSNAWQRFYGNISGNVLLAPNNVDIFYKWLWDGRNGKVYAVNSDATISWMNLTALGRNTTDENSTSDFTELDLLLNMTAERDSIDALYSIDGSNPIETKNITLWDRIVPWIPESNSSSVTYSQTGIVWDASQDGGSGQFDPTENEDVAFVTEVNSSMAYDYDIRVPANLSTYKGASGRVSFWVELE